MRFLFFVAMLLLTGCVIAGELTDSEANQHAVRMEKSVTATQDSLNRLMASGDRNSYRAEVRDIVQAALDSWPDQNLSNRAIFPYFSCKQAAIDLLQYGDAWVRGEQSKTWREKVTKNFHSDHNACKVSLKKPDLSLKDIQ